MKAFIDIIEDLATNKIINQQRKTYGRQQNQQNTQP